MDIVWMIAAARQRIPQSSAIDLTVSHAKQTCSLSDYNEVIDSPYILAGTHTLEFFIFGVLP